MSAYLDGELASASRARIERHSHECLDCRRLLDGLAQMLGQLARLPSPSGGADSQYIVAAVRRRLQDPPAS